MARLTIRLMGTFEVALDGVPVTRFGANTARAPLAEPEGDVPGADH